LWVDSPADCAASDAHCSADTHRNARANADRDTITSGKPVA
jgi:hypothetical protein